MQIFCGTVAMLRLQLKALAAFRIGLEVNIFSARGIPWSYLFTPAKEGDPPEAATSRIPSQNHPVISIFGVCGVGVSVMEKQRSWSFCTIGVEVALATPHGLLNAKVNNSQRHAYTIILIISCCPRAVITYTPYFPNVSNLFLMSRIIS